MRNRFDRLLKSFADHCALLLVRLAKALPLAGDELVVEATDREQSGPVIPVDHILKVVGKKTERRLHFEFVTHYRSNVRRAMAKVGALMSMSDAYVVDSYMMILNPKRVPRKVPAFGIYRKRGLTITYRYKVIKVWELNPKLVLDDPNPRAWPFAALMDVTIEQLREIDRRLGEVPDEQLREELKIAFETFAGLRYDKKEIERIRGTMLFDAEELLRASSTSGPFIRKIETRARRKGVAEGVEKGIERGIEKGIEKGRSTEAVRKFKTLLAVRFPGLEDSPELNRLDDVETVDLLFELAAREKQRSKVRDAIRNAASGMARA